MYRKNADPNETYGVALGRADIAIAPAVFKVIPQTMVRARVKMIFGPPCKPTTTTSWTQIYWTVVGRHAVNSKGALYQN